MCPTSNKGAESKDHQHPDEKNKPGSQCSERPQWKTWFWNLIYNDGKKFETKMRRRGSQF